MAAQPLPSPTQAKSPGVTWRAILLGLVLIPPNAYWVTQMEVVRYQAHPTTISLFFNAVLILLALLGINAGVRRLNARWAFTRQELLTVYTMVVIASAITGHDNVQVLAPQLSNPYRFADPSNQWEKLFFDYLPKFLAVDNEVALEGAYAGGSSLYEPKNYRPWLGPVGWWSAFICAMLLSLLCLASLFRRRWTDDEKLTYPVTQLPIEVCTRGSQLFTNRIFWIGFGIAAFVDLVNGFHELYPLVPLLKVRVVHFDQMMASLFTVRPWTAFSGTRVSLYPFAVGMGLLLPLDLLFSCWFFFWFAKLQMLLAAMVGWDQIPQFPFIRDQAFGGYIGLSLFGLWISRRYLKHAFRTAMGLSSELEETREPISYRLAFGGTAVGLCFMLYFADKIGMSLPVALAFFLIYFLLSLAVGRIRAELGPPAHDLHHAGPDQFLTALFGTGAQSRLSPQNQTALKLMYWFNRAYRAHPLPCQLEGMKMAQMTGMSQRRFWVAMLLAGVVGTGAAFWAQLHNYYVYGMSAKIAPPAITAFGREPYVELAQWLAVPTPADTNRLIASVVGFAIVLGLNSLRMQLPWFPFHPVGYATATSWSMNVLWMPLGIAYFLKLAVLRYGGYSNFQRLIPGAIGLILGEFVTGGLWTIYGILRQVPTYGFWV
jgi:hypothetical protein